MHVKILIAWTFEWRWMLFPETPFRFRVTASFAVHSQMQMDQRLRGSVSPSVKRLWLDPPGGTQVTGRWPAWTCGQWTAGSTEVWRSSHSKSSQLQRYISWPQMCVAQGTDNPPQGSWGRAGCCGNGTPVQYSEQQACKSLLSPFFSRSSFSCIFLLRISHPHHAFFLMHATRWIKCNIVPSHLHALCVTLAVPLDLLWQNVSSCFR